MTNNRFFFKSGHFIVISHMWNEIAFIWSNMQPEQGSILSDLNHSIHTFTSLMSYTSCCHHYSILLTSVVEYAEFYRKVIMEWEWWGRSRKWLLIIDSISTWVAPDLTGYPWSGMEHLNFKRHRRHRQQIKHPYAWGMNFSSAQYCNWCVSTRKYYTIKYSTDTKSGSRVLHVKRNHSLKVDLNNCIFCHYIWICSTLSSSHVLIFTSQRL